MEDALIPYFKSFVAEKDGAPSYLVHHRAFCERARQLDYTAQTEVVLTPSALARRQGGLKVHVDTRIRASVIGMS